MLHFLEHHHRSFTMPLTQIQLQPPTSRKLNLPCRLPRAEAPLGNANTLTVRELKLVLMRPRAGAMVREVDAGYTERIPQSSNQRQFPTTGRIPLRDLSQPVRGRKAQTDPAYLDKDNSDKRNAHNSLYISSDPTAHSAVSLACCVLRENCLDFRLRRTVGRISCRIGRLTEMRGRE